MTKMATHTSRSIMELTSPITPPARISCCPCAYFKTIADPTIPATVKKKPIEERIIRRL